MNCTSIQLLDLPDEILLIIMKKLGSVDVLYSLLDVNKRLDQMARSINNTTFLDFSVESRSCQFSPNNQVKLDRFCSEVLPQINHEIIAFRFDLFSMKHILLACEYPNLQMLIIDWFLPFILLRYFIEKPSIILFCSENRLHTLLLVSRKFLFSNKQFTQSCGHIVAMCTKLSYLDINQLQKYNRAKLVLWWRTRNLFHSLHLRTLIIDVSDFDDCCQLLDGRLNQLSSFIVNIHSFEKISRIDDHQKVISNLKLFSLTCYSPTDAYESRIIPLLRRMPNLNGLILHLYVKQSEIIDGIHLNKTILCHMLHLNTFTFHICTIMLTNHFLSTKDIQKTFINWKYSPINCCIDQFSDGSVYSHIYSISFRMTRFIYLTNSSFGQHLESVTDLTLLDTRPFEDEFFQWLSRAFPLLKYLKINNLTPQKNNCENDKKISSKIFYLYLIRLELTNAHINYAYQFLCDTEAYIPCLHTLKIRYAQLVTVTNNFTNNATRINCGQIKQLLLKQEVVYPEHFYLYFPCLLK